MELTKRHTAEGPIGLTSLPVASQKCPAAPGSTLGGYCGLPLSQKEESSIGSSCQLPAALLMCFQSSSWGWNNRTLISFLFQAESQTSEKKLEWKTKQTFKMCTMKRHCWDTFMPSVLRLLKLTLLDISPSFLVQGFFFGGGEQIYNTQIYSHWKKRTQTISMMSKMRKLLITPHLQPGPTSLGYVVTTINCWMCPRPHFFLCIWMHVYICAQKHVLFGKIFCFYTNGVTFVFKIALFVLFIYNRFGKSLHVCTHTYRHHSL